MPDNWLATLGSWVVYPGKVILTPWWDRLVESKAESEAVRKSLLEAIVRFRVRDYKEMRALDSDRASGLVLKIAERFKTVVKEYGVDLSGSDFLDSVEREIHLHAVPLSAWMQLACLGELVEFNPNHALSVEFTDDKGNQSHAASVIVTLGSSFPFINVWKLSGIGHGQLSTEALELLREYCSRNNLPEAKYEIVEAVTLMAWPHQFGDFKILPRNWKPK